MRWIGSPPPDGHVAPQALCAVGVGGPVPVPKGVMVSWSSVCPAYRRATSVRTPASERASRLNLPPRGTPRLGTDRRFRSEIRATERA